MQTLRNAHLLARLVLVWFVLFVGVSVASPMVSPQSSQMVCSAMGGMKMVSADDGVNGGANGDADGGAGDTVKLSSNMDCPLCAQFSAPPSPVVFSFDTTSALAHALRPIPSAHIAWLTGSPLPPRGPPVLS
jgi:hypothetical protein